MTFRCAVVINLLVFAALASQPSIAQNTKENADFKLALNLFNDGLYDLAAEQFRQFITNYPASGQSVEARFHLGLAQLKLKQYDEARLSFQTFAITYQDNPKAPEAWWYVGESYAGVKNYREAALAFERVKMFHPKSKTAPLALVEASKYFRLGGSPADARRVLRIVLQEYSSSTATLAARRQLGLMYFEEGTFDLAQNELRRVIEGNPSPEEKAEALLVLGNIYQKIGNTDLARSTYQEILTRYTSSPVVQGTYVNLGKLEANTGRYVQAIDQFKKALSEKGAVDSVLLQEAIIGSGDAYASLGDFSNAVSYYDRFIDSFPNAPQYFQVLWNISSAASKGKDYLKSNDASSRILKSKAPEIMKRRALLKLARNAEEQKNPAQAVQHYSAFLDQYADDRAVPDVLFRIASVHEMSLRDLRKAAAYYEMLLTRFPRAPLADDAYYRAAGCYTELKEFDRSLQLYEQLVRMFPASDYREAAVERIATITTFEVKDKDSGLEKLALLLGDVVAERDKVGLAFKLGEIYFKDLKNYFAAASQFNNAINSGMTDRRFVDALFYRAKSYEYLAQQEETYRQQAIEAYQTFLKSYPAEARSEEAAFAVFTLSATSAAEARRAYTATLSSYPNFKKRDAMLLRIGKLEQKSDTAAVALATFAKLIREFPASASAAEGLHRSMEIWMKLGVSDSAISAGTAYLRTHAGGPYTGTVLSRLATLSLQKGNARSAAEYFQRLVEEYPYASAAADAQRHLAQANLEAGNYRKGVATYAELYNDHMSNPFSEEGPDPGLLFGLGKAHQLSGNATEAKKYLSQFLVLERTGNMAGEALNALGLIYRNEGSIDLATAYFRQAGQIAPGTASREIADLMFNSGNFADAIRQYTQLLQSAQSESDRKYYDAQIIIARLRSDELAVAEKLIGDFDKRYKNTDEEMASFELERGNHYFRKKDYATARRLFDRIASKYDKTQAAPAALYWIGKILEMSNKTQEAIKLFTDLIKDYPRSSTLQRAHLSLGNIYYTAEKWDESIQNYKRIVDDPKADPEILPYAMNNLIETYESASIYDAALALTRKYLERYPNAEDTFDKRIKIGILYLRLGYNEQASLHLQTLLDEAGSDLEGEIRFYIAEAHYNKGDYQQAILEFLKVPYLVTKKGRIDWTANALYMAGQSYERLDRYDQALTMYQQIVERIGIDETFKSAARKEIDRVKLVLKKSTN